jgi:hypothetical protein
MEKVKKYVPPKAAGNETAGPRVEAGKPAPGVK